MLTLSAAIRDLEDFLAAPADAIEPRHYRACLLALLGRHEQAHSAFMELLDRDSKHFGVLNDFGTFLYSRGQRQAATFVLNEAVKLHPENSLGHANLGCLYVSAGEFENARRHFEIALKSDPANAIAQQGMRAVESRNADAAPLNGHRAPARKRSIIAPFAHAGKAVKILLVESALGGNVFAHGFLDDPAFEKKQVFLEHLDQKVPLPEHDVIWSAVGDAERCANLLDVAPAILSRSRARVINAPETVRHTSRVEMARRLSRLEGVVAPQTCSVMRLSLAGEHGARTIEELGLKYPLLFRSPGFHTGEYLLRVDSADQVRDAAMRLPGRLLTLVEFVDVRNAGGKVRKHRVVIVDGKIFPLHVAENDSHGAEDEAFLCDMTAVLGDAAMAALERAAGSLRLDYGGMDFALDGDGRVIVFEANATVPVPEPDEDERRQYRISAVQRIYDAVRRMIIARVPSRSS